MAQNFGSTITEPAPFGSAGNRWDLSRAETWQDLGSLLSGYVLPFVLVAYLAFKGGGYDTVVRSETGILVWWIVLLGCLVGTLPSFRLTTAGWIGLGLFVALTGWTALGLTWTESSDRTLLEVSRVVMLLGVFCLSLFAQGREGLRRTVCAIGTAVALVALFALLSRIQPAVVSSTDLGELLPSAAGRLSYPLGYWNGLAAVIALGAPLLLWMALRGRTTAGRALAAAAVPVLALTLYFTFSRGGIIEMAAAVFVLVLLMPGRITAIPTLLNVGTGSLVLVLAAAQRDAISEGVNVPGASTQGDELLVMALLVCGGVALIQAAIAKAPRSRLSQLTVPRSASLVAAGSAVLFAVILALAMNVPGKASDTWSDFKASEGTGSGVSRLDSSSGNGRYQYWSASMDQFRDSPVTGAGPGTFEYAYAREGTTPGFVRDAHSLYIETLGELGLVGAILIVSLLLFVVTKGTIGSIRKGSDERRGLLAAAVAASVAFMVAGSIDWIWEMTVIPVILLLLFGAILSPSGISRRGKSSRFKPGQMPWPGRIAVGVAAVAAIALLAVPLSSTSLLEKSQAAFRDGDSVEALSLAKEAGRVEPNGAAPALQQALILESHGLQGAALGFARQATRDEPVDWRNWMVRSRIAAEAGNAREALVSFRRARSLNPRSMLFQ